MDIEWERVAGPMGYTEGPVWNGEAVLFTDIPGSRIMRYDPSTDECTVHVEGTDNAVGLQQGPDDNLYSCEKTAHGIGRYTDKGSTLLVDEYDGKRLNSPNDLCFDSKGRLWFSDPDYSAFADHSPDIGHLLELGHESVFRLDPTDGEGWEITRVTHDTTKPNGVQVSLNEAELFVAQSNYGEGNDRELRSYPIRNDGSLGDYEVLHNFYPHRGIDGMCLDQEGNIVATAGWEESGPGPMIYVFTPNGRVLETYPMPARPSNCTFGDEDLMTLYVTGEGCLFRARTEREGFIDPIHRFS